MKCVILCAGESRRMGGNIPKVLIPINGKPLLHHVIRMWENSVDGFIFVLSYKWIDTIKILPKNSIYVFQDSQKGIADAILKVEPLIDGAFIVALGDCIQKGEWQVPSIPSELGISVWETDNSDAIRASYSVEIKDGYISKVVEKPKELVNNYCGMGTYFFDQRVFGYIRKTPISTLRNEVEITDTIQLMIDSKEKITPIFFRGDYLNVTYPEDIQKAEEMLK